MKWLRVSAAALAAILLGLVIWHFIPRPRSTGGSEQAPRFTATVYGRAAQADFPRDYAGKWVWLVFTGLD